MTHPFRTYEPHELDGEGHKRGYPYAWRDLGDGSGRGVKDLVCEQAGHRCERCSHPYVVRETGSWSPGAEHPPEVNGGIDRATGQSLGWASIAFWPDEERLDAGEIIRASQVHWSPCDEGCTHRGPIRYRAHTSLPDGEKAPWVRLDAERITAGETVAADWEVEAAWRILTVHHLNERKHDLRWWNLAALCQRCHLYVQRRVQMERVYPWEHTEWFRPHAAGWYAYAYLGEELTRDETMERLDELLALECVA